MLDLLKKTQAKKDASKIAERLAYMSISTVAQLAESVTKIGAKLFGYDIFQLINELQLAEAGATISADGIEPDSIPAVEEPDKTTAPKTPRKSRKGQEA